MHSFGGIEMAGVAIGDNRLAGETSPYLLQHAGNPVEWYPWGPEALQTARRENKPIFLSIGYSACHWCHVMERESFENVEIAAFLNAHFVPIKVDREERPDLDTIYMTAVVAMTGHGGWPMSVFLTPDLKPFYGGTYYPPEDRYGHPGFTTILQGVASIWENRQDEVLKSAAGLTGYLEAELARRPAPGPLSPALLDRAVSDLSDTYDKTYGGWGGAPKFPSSGAIAVLLREFARSGNTAARDMALRTLDKMAAGGMYDQLGGGFHRYSVDDQWLVPHFEKMLYDNAQLAAVYLEAYQLTGAARYRRVAEETLDYVLRDMTDAAGGFYSSEDADSEGEEGAFYLWTEAEILDALGPELGRRFCQAYRANAGGNFPSHEPYHQGKCILVRGGEAGDLMVGGVAKRRTAEPLHGSGDHATTGILVRGGEEEIGPIGPIRPIKEADPLAEARARLLALRAERVRPGCDDKVLTSWNALMISALARAAQVLDSARYRQAAVRAAEFLRGTMFRDGTLLRTYRAGEARLPGYLDDYAFTANALADVYEATFDPWWLVFAEKLTRAMRERFWDEHAGVFFFTEAAHDDVLLRSAPTHDGAEPSGNSTAALALLRLAKLTGKAEYGDLGRRVLEAHAEAMARVPQAYLKMLLAVDFLLHPGEEIAVIGPLDRADTRALLAAARSPFRPNSVLAAGEEGAETGLLARKKMVDGKAAAYVCRDSTCSAPVTEPAALIP